MNKFFYIVSIFFLASNAFAFDIKINERSVINEERIFLRDIIDAKNQNIPESVLNIEIGKSPPPCKKKQIRKNRLLYLIKKTGINLKDIRIDMPFSVQVERYGVEISKERLEGILKEYLSDKLKDFSFKNFRASGLKPLPSDNFSLKVLGTKKNKFVGNIRVPVNILLDRKVYKKINLSANVIEYNNVLLLLKDIEKGQKITKKDCSFGLLNKKKINKYHLKKFDVLEGFVAKRNISKGEFLNYTDLEKETLIYKNDIVEIIAKRGKLIVSTLGKAMGKASINEKISVENIDTNKIIEGKVIGSSKVEILF